MSDPRFYRVFKLKFTVAMQDPDMRDTGIRYHTVIFVETYAEGPGSGTKHHVTGDIVTGMCYETNTTEAPESTEGFHLKELIGHTDISTYPDAWDSVLKAEPAPPKQKAFNIQTMKTEPVKSWDPLTFYAPGEPRVPLVKCTEWIERQAIPALEKHSLLKTCPF